MKELPEDRILTKDEVLNWPLSVRARNCLCYLIQPKGNNKFYPNIGVGPITFKELLIMFRADNYWYADFNIRILPNFGKRSYYDVKTFLEGVSKNKICPLCKGVVPNDAL